MDLASLSPDPILAFTKWLDDARTTDGHEFTHAVALATSTPAGRPSVRMVLFKGLNKNDFTFFTNLESRKGRELAANPFAALCFYWENPGRQVRVEGRVEALSAADSDAYFRTRPRGSQLGAWASPQSRPIASRATLEQNVRDAEVRFGPGEIPRPANWAGFRLVPDRIEFWQNGANRLHDRIEYARANAQSIWTTQRLAP